MSTAWLASARWTPRSSAVRHSDTVDGAPLASERSVPSAVRYSDTVDGALASARSVPSAVRHSDTVDGAPLASERSVPSAVRHSDTVDGALASARSVPSAVRHSDTEDGAPLASVRWTPRGTERSVPSTVRHSDERPPRWLDFPWTLALVIGAIVATALHQVALAGWLVADDRFALGEPWRLATGPFVHATWGHLVRDAALVALVGCAYEAPLASGFRWFVAFALVVPTTAVLLATNASWYCGLSGVSHALFAAAIVLEVRQRRGVVRGLALLVGAVFAAKPIYELATGAPAFPMDLGPGVRQVPLAHLAGVAIGIVFGSVSRVRPPPSRC